MFTKEQIQKRTKEIYDELVVINSIQEREKRDLTEAEELKFYKLMEEFNSNTNLLNSQNGKSERVHFSSFAEVKDYFRKPVNEPMMPNIRAYDSNGNELRFFTKENLPELRSYIGSKGKLGITNCEELSFGKFARALITGDWSKAPNEFRVLGTSTDGGGYLIPEEISSIIIPMALNKAQAISAGAITIPMDNKTLVIPRIASMPQTEWKAENAEFSKSTDMTFDGINLEAKTLMALITMSIELASDGVGVEQAIEMAISQAIALEIDRACLAGAAGNEPRGIIHTSGILTELAAAINSYTPFSNAFYKVEAENGTVNALIAPSSVYASLDLLRDKNNQPLNPPISWSKYKQFSSNQLTNQSIMGDFKQLFIGMRNTINLEVTRYTTDAFKKMQVWIRAYIRMDLGLRQAAHFCVISETSS